MEFKCGQDIMVYLVDEFVLYSSVLSTIHLIDVEAL
jgi:hypothetical protein